MSRIRRWITQQLHKRTPRQSGIAVGTLWFVAWTVYEFVVSRELLFALWVSALSALVFGWAYYYYDRTRTTD